MTSIETEVYLEFPDGSRRYPLGGSALVDQTWSPYTQATVILPREGDDYLNDLLDPTATYPATLVNLYLWRRSPDTYTVDFQDLVIRSVSTDYLANETTLTLTSKELLMQDFRVGNDVLFGTVRVGDIVADVIERVYGPDESIGALDYAQAPTSRWEAGQSAWDLVNTVLAPTGYRLVADPNTGSLKYADNDWAPAFTDDAALGPDQYTTLQASRDRDSDWFDGYVVRYDWTDDNGNERTQKAYAGAVRYGRKWGLQAYNQEGPGSAAVKTAANALLARAKDRRTKRVIIAPWARRLLPGRTLTLTPPDRGKDIVAEVSAIEFMFDGQMKVTAYSDA